MSKVLSVRVDDTVAARVEELASGRSMKSSAWLKEAVASYLDDHERGVPDAPRATVSATRPEPVRQPLPEIPPQRFESGQVSRVFAAREPVDRVAAARERQAKLNDARYGKGNW